MDCSLYGMLPTGFQVLEVGGRSLSGNVAQSVSQSLDCYQSVQNYLADGLSHLLHSQVRRRDRVALGRPA